MRKSKGFIAITSLLVAIVVICCSFLVTNFIERHGFHFAAQEMQKPEDGGGSAGFYFTEESIAYTGDYDKYTTFNIIDKTGLFGFAKSAAYYGFEGKTVKLMADINITLSWILDNDTSFYPIGAPYYSSYDDYQTAFQGTFDGNGHNIKIETVNLVGTIANPNNDAACGLFYRLGSGAEIKNLNLEIELMSTDYFIKEHFGGLAGETIPANKTGSKGITIKNCMFKTSIDTTDKEGVICYYGGIIGYADCNYSIEVSDCYIEFICDTGKKTSDHFYISTMIAIQSTTPILKNSVIIETSGYPVTCMQDSSGNFIGGTNIKYAKNDTTGLSCSILGGASVDTWYYGGNSYNEGFPYLRAFIKNWTTITFVADTGGSVTGSPIKIPSSVENHIAGWIWHKTNNPLTICKQEVIASADTGYTFYRWEHKGTVGSTYTYKATFSRETYKITFSQNDKALMFEDLTYHVFYGTKITVSYIGYGRTYNNCEAIQFSFTTSDGAIMTVRYTSDSLYYISGTSFGNVSNIEIKSNTTLDVTASLKSYQVVLK